MMNNLRELASLHAAGNLTDYEFAKAKRRFFREDLADVPQLEATPQHSAEHNAYRPQERRFCASRWSSGNHFFPDSVVLTADGITFRKGGLVGSTEEHINYHSVASCRVINGVFLASITIETAGGTQPIFLKGLWKLDAQAVLEMIKSRQSA